jgi:hypothetical protein
MNERTGAAAAQQGTTNFGDTYWMIQPSFETGDSRYAWLNQVLAAGEGRFSPEGVEYRVYGLVND